MFVGSRVRDPQGLFWVAVTIDGQEQDLYQRSGGNRYYVAGVPGASFQLRVGNTSHGRLEILTSIDGRNTLEDEPADLGRNRGLVVRPGDTASFTGWRTSQEGTEAFVFGLAQHSIADRATGSTANTGVIGIAAYEEASYGGFRGGGTFRGDDMIAKGGLESMTMGEEPTRGGSMGTHMGGHIHDPVGSTRFTRYGNASVVTIGYDTEEWLRSQGILLPAEPNPFPGAPTGYAKYTRD